MADVGSFLTEWTVDYVKNRDVLIRKLVSVEKNKKGFDVVVKYKDKVCFFIVRPLIKDIEEVIKKIDKEKNYGLVIMNNKNNFEVIMNNWKKLIEFRNLCIYFVNPFSQLEKKWLIFPCTHNRICDNDSLENGLKAMFETVEPITEEELKKKLK